MNLVTGATGFIGANLVRELLCQGEAVRVLVRPGSDRRNLESLSVELAEGDLGDRASLRRALRGSVRCFHVAAAYQLWVRDPRQMYATNVEGTRALLEEAAEAGVERVVYTSSVGTLGIPSDDSPGTEETPVGLEEMVGHYKRSKFLAEREAEGLAAKGVPVVIVNPSAPVGPWDVKPTPTGRMIVDYLRGKMFAYLETGVNVVHVRDVARGHILAAEKGRVGEKYILGNRNLTLLQVFAVLERLSGIPAPRWRIPYPVAFVAGTAFELGSRLTGREPRVSVTAVRMARKRMFFDPGKAIRELGLPQTPVEEAFREAVEWFRARGYC